LFIKLLERGSPRVFIDVLVSWMGKCAVNVRWGDFLSSSFSVTAGVRQGGVLSPFLFAIYLDIVILRLRDSGWGLFICQTFIGCLVYADDIMLIANSITHMQHMLDICSTSLAELDLRFNVSKSAAMRIGPRFWRPCLPLMLDSKPLLYVSTIKYLGVHVVQGRTWRTSITQNRASFYRSFNAILAKTKSAASEMTSLFLVNTICRPILLYALEACSLSRSQMSELDGMIDNCIRKIFGVQSNDCISYIRDIFKFNIVSSMEYFITAKCKLLLATSCNRCPYSSCVFRLAFNECLDPLIRCDIDLRDNAVTQLRHLLTVCRDYY
jgi:hypothetical protein